jgi:hypothetical protein
MIASLGSPPALRAALRVARPSASELVSGPGSAAARGPGNGYGGKVWRGEHGGGRDNHPCQQRPHGAALGRRDQVAGPGRGTNGRASAGGALFSRGPADQQDDPRRGKHGQGKQHDECRRPPRHGRAPALIGILIILMPPWAQQQDERDGAGYEPCAFGDCEDAGDNPAASIGQQRACLMRERARTRSPMTATASKATTVAVRAVASAPSGPGITSYPGWTQRSAHGSAAVAPAGHKGDWTAGFRNGTPLVRRGPPMVAAGRPMSSSIWCSARRSRNTAPRSGHVVPGTAARLARTATQWARRAAPELRGPWQPRTALRVARSPTARVAAAALHRARPCRRTSHRQSGRSRWRCFRVPGGPPPLFLNLRRPAILGCRGRFR